MKDTHIESDAAPVFKLAELARLYKTRLKLFGGDVSGRFNNTHLKTRILAHQQDLQVYREGRDVLLAFSKDVRAALRQAYRNAILMTKPGFCDRLRRLFGGSNIQTQTNNSFEIQAVFSVAQCIFYNSTFRHRNRNIAYHNTIREPPLPIYVGLLLHGETRKRSLVDKFYDLGLSVSYDRVFSISDDLRNDT